MKKLLVLFLMMSVVLVLSHSVWAQVVGSGFTYQGKLHDGGSAANGKYDMEFTLFNALASGSQVGRAITKDDVNVYDGNFTVLLDFGSLAFNGDGRWLAIRVRPYTSTGVYTSLSPRGNYTCSLCALRGKEQLE